MKTRFIIIVLPFLLALGLVTVALAAAQSSVPAAQSPVPGAQNTAPAAQNSVPAAGGPFTAADRLNNLAGVVPQTLQPPAGQNQLADTRKASVPSSSAMMPGFLQAKDRRPYVIPLGRSAQVDGEAAWHKIESPTTVGD